MKNVVGMLKDLTAGHERLEQSATINEKRKIEIERNAAQQAKLESADNVEQAAKQLGLSSEQAQFWRDQVLMGA
jgi:hypothetical protein